MNDLPLYVSLIFLAATVYTFCFLFAARIPRFFMLIMFGWLALTGLLAHTGYYTVTDTTPPRFLLLVAPPILFIVLLFLTRRGRSFVDGLNLRVLTLLHTVRVIVEVVLLLLFIYKKVPGILTFEGRNFDIISGITAPVIFYLGFVKKTISLRIILVWNFVCLALLFNVVGNAVLSAPLPFQQFAFDQPNIAILYFPFVWLPAFIVPAVLFAHLTAIRQLIKRSA